MPKKFTEHLMLILWLYIPLRTWRVPGYRHYISCLGYRKSPCLLPRRLARCKLILFGNRPPHGCFQATDTVTESPLCIPSSIEPFRLNLKHLNNECCYLPGLVCIRGVHRNLVATRGCNLAGRLYTP